MGKSKIDLANMDVRVIEFHLRNRSLSRADYDTYLNRLDDSADEGEETETAFAAPFEGRSLDSEAVDASA